MATCAMDKSWVATGPKPPPRMVRLAASCLNDIRAAVFLYTRFPNTPWDVIVCLLFHFVRGWCGIGWFNHVRFHCPKASFPQPYFLVALEICDGFRCYLHALCFNGGCLFLVWPVCNSVCNGFGWCGEYSCDGMVTFATWTFELQSARSGKAYVPVVLRLLIRVPSSELT